MEYPQLPAYSHRLMPPPAKQPEQLSRPEDKRSRNDDGNPVWQTDRCDIEHPSAQLHNDNLTEEDEQDDDAESPASLEVEGTAPCSEGTGIEHIPELQEYKNGKEQRKLISR